MNERFFIKTIAFYNIRQPWLHPKYRKSAINVAKTPRGHCMKSRHPQRHASAGAGPQGAA
jgi:hypothetical protein